MYKVLRSLRIKMGRNGGDANHISKQNMEQAIVFYSQKCSTIDRNCLTPYSQFLS